MSVHLSRKHCQFSKVDFAVCLFLAGLFIFFASKIHSELGYTWRWGLLFEYIWHVDVQTGRQTPGLLLLGLITTIRLSVWSIVLAMLIGLVMGIARSSRFTLPRMLGTTYVELIRNTPPLVLIYLVYFFLAEQVMTFWAVEDMLRSNPLWLQKVIGVVAAPMSNISNFIAALFTMALYEGAYITEHVRAGIASIEKNQHEAAYALGLTRLQSLRHIILPQATGRIAPPLAGQFISTIKDTSIVSVISVQELTFQGLEVMSAVSMTFEIMIALAILYFTLCWVCSVGGRYVENRLKVRLGHS